MRKLALLMVSLAVVICAVSTVQALSSGPGGRLYMAARVQNPTSGLWEIGIKSLTLDENWNMVEAAMVSHGAVNDNCAAGIGDHQQYGCSPEILTPGGDGYGELLMGAYYNYHPVGIADWGAMDVVKVTPSDGSNSVSVLGNGKGTTSGVTTWTCRFDVCTAGGELAVPYDESSVFFVNNLNNKTEYLLVDSVPDGDITDDDSDYTQKGIGNALVMGTNEDQEVFDGKVYMSSGWGPWDTGKDCIGYYEKTATQWTLKAFAYDGPAGGIDLYKQDLSGQGFAMAKVTVGGAEHTAAWMTCYDPDCGSWGTNGLALLVDLNDDGDAMDAGEAKWIYDYNSAAGSNNNFEAATDIEYVENEEGKKFLILFDNTNNWHRGFAMFIMELADNGEYIGGDDGIKVIDEWSTGIQLRVATSLNEIEFDSNLNVEGEIPEPATLLLLGTGLIGAYGVIRRRRLS